MRIGFINFYLYKNILVDIGLAHSLKLCILLLYLLTAALLRLRHLLHHLLLHPAHLGKRVFIVISERIGTLPSLLRHTTVYHLDIYGIGGNILAVHLNFSRTNGNNASADRRQHIGKIYRHALMHLTIITDNICTLRLNWAF